MKLSGPPARQGRKGAWRGRPEGRGGKVQGKARSGKVVRVVQGGACCARFGVFKFTFVQRKGQRPKEVAEGGRRPKEVVVFFG